MTNSNKVAYNIEYDKANQRQFALRVNKIHDGDMIEWLEAQSSIQGYIKDLIRKDMEEKKLQH